MMYFKENTFCNGEQEVPWMISQHLQFISHLSTLASFLRSSSALTVIHKAKSLSLCILSDFMLYNVLSATVDACGYRSAVHPDDRR